MIASSTFSRQTCGSQCHHSFQSSSGSGLSFAQNLLTQRVVPVTQVHFMMRSGFMTRLLTQVFNPKHLE
jgi:hypothetical protein